jgi:hypothetical protein
MAQTLSVLEALTVLLGYIQFVLSAELPGISLLMESSDYLIDS